MKNSMKYIIMFASGILMSANIFAQTDWGITPDQKAELSKIEYNIANQEAGEALFNLHCKVCHSEMSVVPKNTRALPLSPNLGSQEIQKNNTDGDLFYKILKGNPAGTMPTFEKRLSEDERWKLVAYIRTFYPDYKPAIATAAPAAEVFKGKITGMTIALDTASKKVIAKLTATDSSGNPVNAKNVKVDIYVKRAFGSLLLGTIKTDGNSTASVEIPEDIPADTAGFITISAAVSDSSAFASAQVAYGQKLQYINPLDEPAMWGTRSKAPLWLKITYLTVVLGVWLTIGWAAFQLFRIYNLRER